MLSLFVFFQVKEERNQVILDNEELQEQLDMSNTAQSAGNVKLNELKNEMIKVTEDLTRYAKHRLFKQSSKLTTYFPPFFYKISARQHH